MLQNNTANTLTTPSSTASRLPNNGRSNTQHSHGPRASTLAAYDRDVNRFIQAFGGEIPCSADLLIRYIVESSKRISPATIARRCLAIQAAHLRGGHPSPTADNRIREALRLMARGNLPVNLMEKRDTKGGLLGKVIDKRSAKPISRALLTRMIEAMGSGTRTADRRDKVVLLLGFAGFKRAELCAINLEDIKFTEEAMVLRYRYGDLAAPATDDTYRTLTLPFIRGPLCTATAIQTWITHCDWEESIGPLLTRLTRSGEPATGQRLDAGFVNVIVKSRLKAAGIADVTDYSAESLRRGGKEETVNRDGK